MPFPSKAGQTAIELVHLRQQVARMTPQMKRIAYLQRLVRELGDENLQLRRQLYGGTRIKKQKSGRRSHASEVVA